MTSDREKMPEPFPLRHLIYSAIVHEGKPTNVKELEAAADRVHDMLVRGGYLSLTQPPSGEVRLQAAREQLTALQEVTQSINDLRRYIPPPGAEEVKRLADEYAFAQAAASHDTGEIEDQRNADRQRETLHAAIDALASDVGWQPIETAPRDGTRVDLWMVDQDGEGNREANAYFVTNRGDEVSRLGPDGRVQREHFKRDGWWAPNHDYGGDDGFCDKPRYCWNGQWRWCLPTHWRAIPAGPSSLPSHSQKESKE